MSDYNEAPSNEAEIEDVISEAKKAAKAQNPNRSGKSRRNYYRNKNRNRTRAQDEESSENLFSEIDSVADAEEDDDENLSPKMKSAKEFSDAFVTAKRKRDEDLQSRRSSHKEISETEEYEEDEAADEPQEQPETAEPVNESEAQDDAEEEPEYDEFVDEDESADFEVDSEAEEEEYVDESSDSSEEEEYDGIFDTDDENEEYIEDVDVDDENDDLGDDDDDDDNDDNDDEEAEEEEEEEAFSTKAKVLIGVIIAILVLAIVGAGVFFMNKGDKGGNTNDTVSQAADGSVTGIHFAEPAVSLRVGETVPLNIVVEPEDAKDKVLKLKSNDPTIAVVDEQGKLTGVASGSTTVTATLKNNESIVASLIVNVIDDDQDAINVYNNFVNALVDGSTDIDSEEDTDTESEQQYDEFGNPIESEDTDSDTDTEAQNVITPKATLTGNIIKDLDDDGSLELALYFKSGRDESEVRIFRLADPDEETEEEVEEEPQYDEFGNLIEPEDTDTETDTEKKDDKAPSEKVLTEVPAETELYNTCYSKIEEDGASWNTSFIEIKEEESASAKVTILSSGYESPSYTFESEDKTIATVDNQGTIKAVKPGTTYIIVTSPLNSDAMAKIKVRIKDDTDLLDDYLDKIPTVNSTNDAVFPTETLTGKAIIDIDNDGVSELLLRFDYGEHVQTINMVKVENEKCVVYKTYNNLSDLYEYNEGKGYYSNSILVHYTSGKVCMEYRGVVSKDDSKSRTTEQKILSLEKGGSLSELVHFRTTTDITTKTVTSEVEIGDDYSNNTSSENTTSVIDTDSEVWYDDTDSEESDSGDNTGYDNDENEDYGIEASYAQLSFDDIVEAEDNGIDFAVKKAEKKLPEAAAAPEDEDDDNGDYDYDNDYDNNDYDNDNDNNDNDDADNTPSVQTNDDDDDEPSSRMTSTVTSEITEETTKYFVNGSPVEQSVYEEMLATYSARYSVWSAWEKV